VYTSGKIDNLCSTSQVKISKITFLDLLLEELARRCSSVSLGLSITGAEEAFSNTFSEEAELRSGDLLSG
jgi:hypothetical protein